VTKDEVGRMEEEVNELRSNADSPAPNLPANERSSSSLRPSSLSLNPSPWRVFCAIEFPADAAARVSDRINSLRRLVPDVAASWNREGKFHLTLKFIGEVPKEDVARLSLAAERATARLSAFNLIVAGAGAFPKKGPPKVLWLGIKDPSERLAKLHAQLDLECTREGFTAEERAFHPHLTIARVRSQRGARALATAHQEMGFAAVEVAVTELSVIRSELGVKGSKYTTISKHRLSEQP